jgi:transcriptional regulator with XRE-family HTH domain
MLREQIIKARKEQGYTQGSLASEIGVRQATISEFESGKRSLRSDILEKILQTLEINIMTTIEEKKMQLELSGKIAKELIAKGFEDIEPLTKETIHMMTRENCGDYILSLPRLSNEEFEKAEKKDTDYKTWNMFSTLLKFDFAYYRRTS